MCASSSRRSSRVRWCRRSNVRRLTLPAAMNARRHGKPWRLFLARFERVLDATFPLLDREIVAEAPLRYRRCADEAFALAEPLRVAHIGGGPQQQLCITGPRREAHAL